MADTAHLLVMALGVLLMATRILSTSLCLTGTYGVVPQCDNTLKMKFNAIEYGVNSDQCIGACCITENIICTQNQTTPDSVSDLCDGQSTCVLSSESDIKSEMITCPGEAAQGASFAILHYSCVEDIPEVTTVQITQPAPVATTKRSQINNQKTTVSPSSGSTDQDSVIGDGRTEPNDGDPKSDMAMVIGVSVAAGIIIIVIVVVIAVVTMRNRKIRKQGGDLSHNSTKTLAASDMENGDSPEPARGQGEDFGFGAEDSSRKERLAKRNDSIRKNLSTKKEENKKNKRPSKLSKSKSKSKSQSLDQLNENNSNNSSKTKESQKKKSSDKSAKKGATPINSPTEGVQNAAFSVDVKDEESPPEAETKPSADNQLSI